LRKNQGFYNTVGRNFKKIDHRINRGSNPNPNPIVLEDLDSTKYITYFLRKTETLFMNRFFFDVSSKEMPDVLDKF